MQARLRNQTALGTLLLPLLAGWGTAFATLPGVPARSIVVMGAVVTGSAVVLGASVWSWCLGRAVAGWRRPVLVVLAAAGLWVWLQYALNPFRMLPLVEAVLASRAAPWQVMAGLWLFGSIVILARARRAELRPAESPAVEAPAVEAPQVIAPPAEPPAALDRITIRLGDRTIVVPAAEIERLQAADDYVAVFAGGRRLLASHRLAYLAERLDPRRFVRVHRSHIVNLEYVESFERVEGERVRVRMRSGAVVPASRAGAAAIRHAASTSVGEVKPRPYT